MMLPVIIPYYQKPEQLERCIAHLQAQSWPVEIFIRDNNQDNLYFTAAVNEGIRKYLDNLAVKYIILLNQDMYLEPQAVAEMVNFMEVHSLCGIGSPLQLHKERPEYVICAGGVEAFPFGRHLHGPLAMFPHNFELTWSNGACMILRKKMIQEIGLLDKNFVFVGSDSDYCFTARSRGWQVWAIVKARGFHEIGRSKISDNPQLDKLELKDMLFFADKWLTGNLYRGLAYEGTTLTADKVAEIVQALKHSLFPPPPSPLQPGGE